MIRLGILCLVIAGVCALLGFGGAASAFAGIAKILFVIALVAFLVLLAVGLFAGKKVKDAID